MPKFPAPKKPSRVSAFGKALKSKITDVMPGSTMVVDNKKDPTSAYSRMMRATEAKSKIPSNFSN